MWCYRSAVTSRICASLMYIGFTWQSKRHNSSAPCVSHGGGMHHNTYLSPLWLSGQSGSYEFEASKVILLIMLDLNAPEEPLVMMGTSAESDTFKLLLCCTDDVPSALNSLTWKAAAAATTTRNETDFNRASWAQRLALPFTSESDRFQISPADSPEMLQHTVWRTGLFIAYSDERWLVVW